MMENGNSTNIPASELLAGRASVLIDEFISVYNRMWCDDVAMHDQLKKLADEESDPLAQAILAIGHGTNSFLPTDPAR